jgi:competence protein ComEA
MLWLAALVGASYLLWSWRKRQGGPPAAPSPRLAPTPAPTAPPTPAAGAPAASGPRRIATRVHRGAPPAMPLRPGPASAAPISAEEAVMAQPAAAPAAPAEAAPISAEEAVMAQPAPAQAYAADPTPISPEEAVMAQPAAPAAPGGLVNINSADAAALIALPGIGPALAARIIAYRTQHGAFADVDQLIDIQGIGPASIAEFRHLITV